MIDVQAGQDRPNVVAFDAADDLLNLNVKSLNLASNAVPLQDAESCPAEEYVTADTDHEAVASVISVVALTWAT